MNKHLFQDVREIWMYIPLTLISLTFTRRYLPRISVIKTQNSMKTIRIFKIFSNNFNLVKNSNLKTMLYVSNNNCIFINVLDSAADVMYSICIIWTDLLFYTRIIWNNFLVSKVISCNYSENLVAFNCFYHLHSLI